MLEVKRFCLNPLKNNIYLLRKDNSQKVLLIDAALFDTEFFDYLQKEKLEIAGILLTHTHFDHVCGLKFLAELKFPKIFVHKEEKDFLLKGEINPPKWPFDLDLPEISSKYLRIILGKEIFNVADFKIEAMETPGHTAGGLSYLIEDEFLFTGDTLFKNCFGRTDLFGGSEEKMRESIKSLQRLAKKVKVYPGHGAFGFSLNDILKK